MTEAANHPSQRDAAPRISMLRANLGATRTLQTAFAAGALLLMAAGPLAANEPPNRVSPLTGIVLPVEPIALGDPRLDVLTTAESARYRRIFELQDAGRFAEADRLIKELRDPLLLGHVRAQRLLHPRHKADYAELTAWLAAHHDHAEARRIHAQAMQRKPAKAAAPRAPTVQPATLPISVHDGVSEPPAQPWGAALDAFRRGQYAAAARQFETIARLPRQTPWAQSAAAYWAARAHMRARNPQRVTPWLEEAARHSRTFYGLIARESLGLEPDLDLRNPPLEAADLAALLAVPAGRRAVALLQADQPERAEQELATLGAAGRPVARAALALAGRANMPNLSLRLGGAVAGEGAAFRDAAAYPVPGWRPPEGFDIDRALIFAFMRQESAFNARARSPAGAAGLMQLMPATASYMAEGERFRGANRERLYEPETNISLGQRYIRHLLADPGVGNNLILLAAAYNGGPGNLAKWVRQVNVADDPLLFIESIPSRETRIFIERVLANLWIYRMRFGQPNDSLADMAAGRWPIYVAIDRGSDNPDVAELPSAEPARLPPPRPPRPAAR